MKAFFTIVAIAALAVGVGYAASPEFAATVNETLSSILPDAQ